ncbi:MAG: hypothetical protein KF887_04935 [Paracoccaceae bacterium]|nr:MAG: hypothetical protein KF887_04935 [Paracoccaceae bacterium]
MLIGLVAFGTISGLLAAAMVLGSVGSFGLAFLAYGVFGSLGATLFAVAMAQRVASPDEDEQQ